MANAETGEVTHLSSERIDATFRNGSLTAISVIVGFSLSFLNRWAAEPGAWEIYDLAAVAAIVVGIVLQISSLASLLSVRSLLLGNYARAVRLFLIGLAARVDTAWPSPSRQTFLATARRCLAAEPRPFAARGLAALRRQAGVAVRYT